MTELAGRLMRVVDDGGGIVVRIAVGDDEIVVPLDLGEALMHLSNLAALTMLRHRRGGRR